MKLVIKDVKLGTQRTRTKKLYLNFFLILIINNMHMLKIAVWLMKWVIEDFSDSLMVLTPSTYNKKSCGK